MPETKKQNRSSHVLRKTIIATCFLLISFVVLFIFYRYQATQKTPSQNLLPAIKRTSIAEEPTSVRHHQLQEADRQFLIAQGLKDPTNDLAQDLMKHNELIPCKGDVGGTPGFYDPEGIAVLSKNQVIASYDDGHVEGAVELAFTVSNGAISWTVTKAECGE